MKERFNLNESVDSLIKELESVGITDTVFAVQADFSDCNSVEQMFKQINNSFKHIDVLVNNAGVSQQKLFTDTTLADYDFVFGVNTLGTVNCCRVALPAMIRKKSGRIINVSSMWGVSGASCEVLYSASKAAVIGFTKALAKEVGPSGVTVNCIAPGVINTKMNKNLSEDDMAALSDETPLCRIGEPEEVAHAVVFLASDNASFITGQILGVDGGFIV